MPDFRSAVAQTPLGDVAVTALGLQSWMGHPGLTRSSAIPTIAAASGRVYMTAIPLRRGQTVSNLIVCSVAAGTGLTFVKLALLNSTGGFAMATASVSATFNSGTGYKVVPLTAAYSVTADGLYNVAFLQYGSGATGANLLTGINSGPASTALGNARPYCISSALLTDISTDVTQADGDNAVWVAVS